MKVIKKGENRHRKPFDRKYHIILLDKNFEYN